MPSKNPELTQRFRVRQLETQCMKGREDRDFFVIVPGGSESGTSMRVAGFSGIKLEQHYVLYLEKSGEPKTYLIRGLSDGIVDLYADASGKLFSRLGGKPRDLQALRREIQRLSVVSPKK